MSILHVFMNLNLRRMQSSSASVESLRKHIADIREKTVKDNKNYAEDDGTLYLSTHGWSTDDVNLVRGEMMKEYYVMNCHTFKTMRLEPLKNAPSGHRTIYPTPFDDFGKSAQATAAPSQPLSSNNNNTGSNRN